MALNIDIEGIGVIANCDAISDTAGGTWFELGGGSISLSTDIYLIGSASIGGKYAGKSGIQALDKGASTYDFTGTEAGQLLYIWVSMTALGTLDTKANYGLCVRLSSGGSATASSNYIDFLIGGSDDANGWTGGWKCFVIDPTETPTRFNGTIATILANVRSIGVWIDCSGSARADSIFIGGMAIGNGLRITGTSTAGWLDIMEYCTDYATRGWGMFQEREGIYYTYGKTYIGDDATPQAAEVSFADSDRIIQFGTSEYWTGSIWASSMAVDSSGLFIEDDAHATNGITIFTDGVIVGTEGGRSGSVFVGNSLMDISLDFFGGSNTDSVTSLYGTQIKGCTGPINSGDDSDHEFLSVTFSGCAQFDPVGAPLIRNCIFAETDSIDGALLWNGSIDITDSSFIANTLGAAVEHDTQGSFGYTDMIFSGNTYDILYSAAASSGTLTINATDSDPSTYEIENPTGNDVDIINTVNLTVTVIDKNRDPILDVQTGIYLLNSPFTELMNEDTIAGGVATQPYNYGGVVDIVVKCRKSDDLDNPRYKPFSSTGQIGASGFSLTVTLVEQPLPI